MAEKLAVNGTINASEDIICNEISFNNIISGDQIVGNANLFDGADLSTDGTLATESDELVPTEKAVKTFIYGAGENVTEDGTLTPTSNNNFLTVVPSTVDITITLADGARVGQKAEIMNIGSAEFKVIIENASEETLVYIYDNEVKEFIWNGTKWIVKCVMPIGSTYEQKAGTEAPTYLFGGTWTDISTDYAGRFFRVEGGNSAVFSDTDKSVSEQAQSVQPHTHSLSIPYLGESGGSVDDVVGCDLVNNILSPEYKSRTTSSYGSTETRPINSAMKIWKRTA